MQIIYYFNFYVGFKSQNLGFQKLNVQYFAKKYFLFAVYYPMTLGLS